jgi:hypothetical protein
MGYLEAVSSTETTQRLWTYYCSGELGNRERTELSTKSSGEDTESKKRFARASDTGENNIKLNLKEIWRRNSAMGGSQTNGRETPWQDPVNIAQKRTTCFY